MALSFREPREAEQVRRAVADLHSHVQFMTQQVTAALGQHAGVPRSLGDLQIEAVRVQGMCFAGGQTMNVPLTTEDNATPFLAAALARYRRTFVADLERSRNRTVSAELIENLDAIKKVLDGLLTSSWYVAAQPPKIPRIREFVTPDRPQPVPPPLAAVPQMDDKFGILLSASQLPVRVEVIRRECEERYVPLGIAFVDVDRLKTLNTEFGETWVDSLILPPLMRAVEGATYGHGAAYRYGGDEFVLVLPSATVAIAHAILVRLQADLRGLAIAGLKAPLTVSVGVCIVQPDAPLTDREVLHWAALAKRKAKEKRDCIAAIETAKGIEPSEFKFLGGREDNG